MNSYRQHGLEFLFMPTENQDGIQLNPTVCPSGQVSVSGAAVNDRKHSELSIYVGVPGLYRQQVLWPKWPTKRHPNSYYASALRLYA